MSEEEGVRWFRTCNDLVHDLVGGAWPGIVLAMWLVRSGAKTALDAETFSTLVRTWSWVLPVVAMAVLLQIVTGAIRLNYWSAHDRSPAKKRTAQLKHLVFSFAFLGPVVAVFMILQP